MHSRFRRSGQRQGRGNHRFSEISSLQLCHQGAQLPVFGHIFQEGLPPFWHVDLIRPFDQNDGLRTAEVVETEHLEFREGGERYHPKGPQGICFFESEGNHVFRYNEFATDDRHYCNDIFGGGIFGDSMEKRCWNKYKELAYPDTDSIEKRLKDAIAKQAEEMATRG